MTCARAIDILTPGKVRYTPQEYEEALKMAREALMSAAGHGESEAVEHGNHPAG